MSDAVLVALVAGTPTALAGSVVAFFQYLSHRETKAVKREVSVNGGKNNPPTLKDDIHRLAHAVELVSVKVDALADAQQSTHAQLERHLDHAAKMDERQLDLESAFLRWRRGA